MEYPYNANYYNGKNLFKYIKGKKFDVTQGGEDNCDYAIDKDLVAFFGVDIIGGEIGDTACLKVFSGETELNKFGCGVNISKDFYRFESRFMSELPRGITIRIEYKSISNKSIGINFIMDDMRNP
jgi:hypothetical protein